MHPNKNSLEMSWIFFGKSSWNLKELCNLPLKSLTDRYGTPSSRIPGNISTDFSGCYFWYLPNMFYIDFSSKTLQMFISGSVKKWWEMFLGSRTGIAPGFPTLLFPWGFLQKFSQVWLQKCLWALRKPFGNFSRIFFTSSLKNCCRNSFSASRIWRKNNLDVLIVKFIHELPIQISP